MVKRRIPFQINLDHNRFVDVIQHRRITSKAESGRSIVEIVRFTSIKQILHIVQHSQVLYSEGLCVPDLKTCIHDECEDESVMEKR